MAFILHVFFLFIIINYFDQDKSFNDSVNGMVVHFYLHCNEELNYSFTIDVETYEMLYFFGIFYFSDIATVIFNAPGGCKKSGISWGVIFFIIFMSLIVLYFAVGIPIQVFIYLNIYMYI
jgi:hypothetical protein